MDAEIQPYQSPDPDDVEIQRPKKSYKRQARPRTLWTDKETADLRRGVELYGAGNWKRILTDKNFHFNPVRTAVDLKDRWRVISAKDCSDSGPAALAGIVFHHEFLDQTTGLEAPGLKSGDLRRPQSYPANDSDENTNQETAAIVHDHAGNTTAHSPSPRFSQSREDENVLVLADSETSNSTKNIASMSSMSDVQGRGPLLSRQRFQDIEAGRIRNSLGDQAVTGDMSHKNKNSQKYTRDESPSIKEGFDAPPSYRTSEWDGDAFNQCYTAQNLDTYTRGYSVTVEHLLKPSREAGRRNQAYVPITHSERTTEKAPDHPSQSIHWEELANRPIFDFG